MKTKLIDNKEEIDEIIRSQNICHISIIDKDNLPYLIPMNFGYDGEFIYLHSGNKGNFVESVEINQNICICFTTKANLAYHSEKVACSYVMQGKSVMLRGNIEFITDLQEKETALNIFMKQYTDRDFKYSEPAIKNVKVYKIKANNITAKHFGAPHK
ncbi:MAG: pyridoxamine 5'-phosphate oxidase family protein [Marinifilaceae bacterium]|jgi:nitroimidazol reductase NimA-like FMN-containing flavoprotein (pyridoxamine 5'-phosphate oxidase superfamily)|nr:pyridoxamine 5'-phosphate oxidase family protein [Marinifilaceae bacterium]